MVVEEAADEAAGTSATERRNREVRRLATRIAMTVHRCVTTEDRHRDTAIAVILGGRRRGMRAGHRRRCEILGDLHRETLDALRRRPAADGVTEVMIGTHADADRRRVNLAILGGHRRAMTATVGILGVPLRSAVTTTTVLLPGTTTTEVEDTPMTAAPRRDITTTEIVDIIAIDRPRVVITMIVGRLLEITTIEERRRCQETNLRVAPALATARACWTRMVTTD